MNFPGNPTTTEGRGSFLKKNGSYGEREKKGGPNPVLTVKQAKFAVKSTRYLVLGTTDTGIYIVV